MSTDDLQIRITASFRQFQAALVTCESAVRALGNAIRDFANAAFPNRKTRRAFHLKRLNAYAWLLARHMERKQKRNVQPT